MIMIRVLALTLLAAISTVTLAATAQQEKMKTCNADASAKALKGDERKAFMSSCLKASAPAAAAPTQQEKMKICNQQAGEKQLKGDERKKFMSDCLKKKV